MTLGEFAEINGYDLSRLLDLLNREFEESLSASSPLDAKFNNWIQSHREELPRKDRAPLQDVIPRDVRQIAARIMKGRKAGPAGKEPSPPRERGKDPAIRVLLVGDVDSGKTALLWAWGVMLTYSHRGFAFRAMHDRFKEHWARLDDGRIRTGWRRTSLPEGGNLVDYSLPCFDLERRRHVWRLDTLDYPGELQRMSQFLRDPRVLDRRDRDQYSIGVEEADAFLVVIDGETLSRQSDRAAAEAAHAQAMLVRQMLGSLGGRPVAVVVTKMDAVDEKKAPWFHELRREARADHEERPGASTGPARGDSGTEALRSAEARDLVHSARVADTDTDSAACRYFGVSSWGKAPDQHDETGKRWIIPDATPIATTEPLTWLCEKVIESRAVERRRGRVIFWHRFASLCAALVLLMALALVLPLVKTRQTLRSDPGATDIWFDSPLRRIGCRLDALANVEEGNLYLAATRLARKGRLPEARRLAERVEWEFGPTRLHRRAVGEILYQELLPLSKDPTLSPSELAARFEDAFSDAIVEADLDSYCRRRLEDLRAGVRLRALAGGDASSEAALRGHLEREVFLSPAAAESVRQALIGVELERVDVVLAGRRADDGSAPLGSRLMSLFDLVSAGCREEVVRHLTSAISASIVERRDPVWTREVIDAVSGDSGDETWATLRRTLAARAAEAIAQPILAACGSDVDARAQLAPVLDWTLPESARLEVVDAAVAWAKSAREFPFLRWLEARVEEWRPPPAAVESRMSQAAEELTRACVDDLARMASERATHGGAGGRESLDAMLALPFVRQGPEALIAAAAEARLGGYRELAKGLPLAARVHHWQAYLDAPCPGLPSAIWDAGRDEHADASLEAACDLLARRTPAVLDESALMGLLEAGLARRTPRTASHCAEVFDGLRVRADELPQKDRRRIYILLYLRRDLLAPYQVAEISRRMTADVMGDATRILREVGPLRAIDLAISIFSEPSQGLIPASVVDEFIRHVLESVAPQAHETTQAPDAATVVLRFLDSRVGKERETGRWLGPDLSRRCAAVLMRASADSILQDDVRAGMEIKRRALVLSPGAGALWATRLEDRGRAVTSALDPGEADALIERVRAASKDVSSILEHLHDEVLIRVVESCLLAARKDDAARASARITDRRIRSAVSEHLQLIREMVLVPAARDARPIFMDATEVSNAKYNAFLNRVASGLQLPAHPVLGRITRARLVPERSHKNLSRPDVPVTKVEWHAAWTYAAAQAMRLPTLAEWKRAWGPAAYPWGGAWDASRAYTCERPGRPTEPTLAEEPNGDLTPSGIGNLLGNVQEWLETDEDSSRFRRAAGAHILKPGRVCRSMDADRCRLDEKPAYVGFRCVADLLPAWVMQEVSR